MHIESPTLKLLLASLTAFSLSQCGPKNEFAPPPPPPVTVSTPIVADQTVYVSFPATLAGVSEVEIRARVRGVLEQSFFEEGKKVEKGAKLFLIEQAPYQATLAASKADVDRANASLALAQANLGRLRRAGPRAVSELDIETAEAEVANAQAMVRQAEAKLDSAEIDLSYTDIQSPVSGRMSRRLVDLGNLVGNGEPTLLTRVVDEKSIRAYYDVPERIMLEYYRRRSEDKDISEHLNKVRLELADGTIYEHLGVIDFIDNKVNESTRTALVRSVFPNPEGELSSGLFARVGYPQEHKDAIMVPSVSVLKDIGGTYVWVVDEKNTVSRRGVTTGPTVQRQQADKNAVPVRDTIITAGLEASDKVIVSGLQRARDGATVTPKMATANQPAKPEQPAELQGK
ncbi:efflux RND transporter periplasmic adaptor subunit [Rubritalea tangerina]|uniref:Efflux RND transporter periplasmic adaptor subunit n=1 Tax=Rubritalea tangerina TaxID=430798 RepID=A0ABW4ZCQ9_9BACT